MVIGIPVVELHRSRSKRAINHDEDRDPLTSALPMKHRVTTCGPGARATETFWVQAQSE